MLRDTAQNLLAAWKRGNLFELESALDRARLDCRPLAEYPADEDERRELLAGIVDEMRASLTRREADGASVYVNLLAHLAYPQPAIPNRQTYLC